MAERKILDELLTEVRACRVCRDAPAKPPALPHEPRPVLQVDARARICLVGQAPGTRVHQSGRPFTDPSGDRLRQWLAVDEATFYDPRKLAIIPMGFCFPGQDTRGADLPPRRECAPAWHERLMAELPAVELLLAVGGYAHARYLSGRSKSLTENVRAWREIVSEIGQPVVFPLPHPSWRNNAWLKKHPWFESELLPDLRRRVASLV